MTDISLVRSRGNFSEPRGHIALVNLIGIVFGFIPAIFLGVADGIVLE